jgi:hypothetical protein
VGTTTERREISYLFAGAGALLLLAAVGMSTVWRGLTP